MLERWRLYWDDRRSSAGAIDRAFAEADVVDLLVAESKIYANIDPNDVHKIPKVVDQKLLEDTDSVHTLYILAVLMEAIVESGNKSLDQLEWLCKTSNTAFKKALAVVEVAPSCSNISAALIYSLLVLQLRALTQLKRYSAAVSLFNLRHQKGKDFPSLKNCSPRIQATFCFYEGVYNVASGSLDLANTVLTRAFEVSSKYNVPELSQRILIYLVPVKCLCEQLLPSQEVFKSFPLIEKLYKQLLTSILRGNISQFSEHLESRKRIFSSNRLYVAVTTMWRLCIVYMLRRVQIEVESSRIPMDLVDKALEWSGYFSDRRSPDKRTASQVLLIAQLIRSGYIKGYVAPEHGLIILSKSNSFPKMQ